MSRGESLIFHSDQGSTAFDLLAPWPPYPSEAIDPCLAADTIVAAFRGQSKTMCVLTDVNFLSASPSLPRSAPVLINN
jgi:hypothetical protein